jgi:hypothetical protein
MFRSRLFVVLLALSAFMFSCSGKDGATGPAGPAGKDGNANVIVFDFPSQTTATGTVYYDFPATEALVDSSVVLAYFQSPLVSNSWYPVPGVGPNASFQTRSYWYPLNAATQRYYLKLVTMAGDAYTTSTTISRMRIYLVPASTLVTITSRGLLDVSDFNAVREYFNLPE